jgi:hypothetical protein
MRGKVATLNRPARRSGDLDSDADTSYYAYYAGPTICRVRAGFPVKQNFGTAGSPDYWILGDARNICELGAPVSYQELDLWLQRYNNGSWHDLPYVWEWDSQNYPGEQFLGVWFNCNHTTLRYYRDYAMGYAIVQGTGYAGINKKVDAFTCPG